MGWFNSPIDPWTVRQDGMLQQETKNMADDNYRIQELLQREVYVGANLVGTIVGERYHPNEDRVRSMRLPVQPNVAET